MNIKNLINPILKASVLLALSSTVFAVDTVTDNLDISLTVQGACSIVSVTDVSKTVAIGAAGAVGASGNVVVNCNNGEDFKIAMGAGVNATAGGIRNVASSGTNIPYTLTKGTSALVWGSNGVDADNTFNNDGTGAATFSDVNGSGSGSNQSFGYGISFDVAGTEATGVYTDTVLVTLEF